MPELKASYMGGRTNRMYFLEFGNCVMIQEEIGAGDWMSNLSDKKLL